MSIFGKIILLKAVTIHLIIDNIVSISVDRNISLKEQFRENASISKKRPYFTCSEKYISIKVEMKLRAKSGQSLKIIGLLSRKLYKSAFNKVPLPVGKQC